MQPHPVSELFPLMPDDELRRLADDIKANGLLFPITTLDGMVLDGRNREAACVLVGVQPRYEPFTGPDPLAFVVSSNLLRRHLTYDQRVGLALKLLPKLEEEAAEREHARKTGTSAKSHESSTPGPKSDEGWTGKSAAHAADLTDTGTRQVEEMAAAEQSRPDLADRLLAGQTKVADVRRSARRETRTAHLVELSRKSEALPQKQYAVIYADPPWRYEHCTSDSRAVENQYPTMDLDAIKALPIQGICLPHCILFMWATSPKLAEAMSVLGAWGFNYRTCAVWVKDKIGMGYYFRQQHELLLVGAIGSPPMPDESARPSSVFNAPRGEHSAKPMAVAAAIEAMYPDLPKVELFCRLPRPGWDAWGYES